ncbi:hypothetical protein U1Q18_027244 [Sarracenia purpurea var. burkii]
MEKRRAAVSGGELGHKHSDPCDGPARVQGSHRLLMRPIACLEERMRGEDELLSKAVSVTKQMSQTNGEPLMPVLVGFGGFFFTLGLTENLAKMRGGYGHPVHSWLHLVPNSEFHRGSSESGCKCTRLGANRVLIFRDYVECVLPTVRGGNHLPLAFVL